MVRLLAGLRRCWRPVFAELQPSHRPVYRGFLCLFFLMIAGYWTLIPVKMGVFVSLVGVKRDPDAKLGTLVALLPLLYVYNWLLGKFPDRRQVGYVVLGFYSICFFVLAWSLGRPEISGWVNRSAPGQTPAAETGAGGPFPPPPPPPVSLPAWGRTVGWLAYWIVETYGSMSLTMLWSIVQSLNLDSQLAVLVYPSLVMATQLGALVGSAIAKQQLHRDMHGDQASLFVRFFLAQSLLLVVLGACLAYVLRLHSRVRSCLPGAGVDVGIASVGFRSADADAEVDARGGIGTDLGAGEPLHTSAAAGGRAAQAESAMTLAVPLGAAAAEAIPGSPAAKPPPKPQGSNALAGFRLILANDYVFAVALVSTLHEVVTTVLSIQMKLAAREVYTDSQGYAEFIANWGIVANLASLLCACLGTRWLIHRLGLAAVLTLFPLVAGGLVVSSVVMPRLGVYFFGMVAMRVCRNALNDPSKELLYTVTDRDVKFQTKSWIDMFGARAAKAGASGVNSLLLHLGAAQNMFLSSLFSGAVVLAWWRQARLVGRMHAELVRGRKVIHLA